MRWHSRCWLASGFYFVVGVVCGAICTYVGLERFAASRETAETTNGAQVSPERGAGELGLPVQWPTPGCHTWSRRAPKLQRIIAGRIHACVENVHRLPLHGARSEIACWANDGPPLT